MRHLSFLTIVALGLTGCSSVTDLTDRIGLNRGSDDVGAPVDPFVQSAPDGTGATLAPETAAPPPPPTATTAEALDTTTAEQRAAAAAPAAAPTRALGTTLATLGSPTEPGLWMKTPLVEAETQGRVTHKGNGKSALVTLIPLEGPATGGSRMSLAALRLIGASLTDITEVDVSVES